MVDWREPQTEEQRATSERSTGDGALDATGAYETARGVVLYDTERPLAWIQSDSAVDVEEMA